MRDSTCARFGYLSKLTGTKTPTSIERGAIEAIKGRWRSAMAQALIAGKDLERELIDYMAIQCCALWRSNSRMSASW